jgi:mannose-6-phosphate isomerase-like protein (cupin superfamily)
MHIGGNVYPIKRGSVAYAPPNVEHSTENTGDEQLIMMLIGVRLD